MKIAVVGAGYVGLIQAACLAARFPVVLCERLQHKLDVIKSGRSPIAEAGLDKLLRDGLGRNLRLHPATDAQVVPDEDFDVIFLCIGTPEAPDGTADVRSLLDAARQIGIQVRTRGVPPDRWPLLVCKSTVPPGTCAELERVARLNVASNPEFLREGTAVDDFFRADRIAIGARSDGDWAKLCGLYAQAYDGLGFPLPTLLRVSRESAELGKYAANTLLAARLVVVNELADVAEVTGADIEEVAKVASYDRRIGPAYLKAGPGAGGSCLPKDVSAVSSTRGVSLPAINALSASNRYRLRNFLFDRVCQALEERSMTIEHAAVCIWGTSFKAHTDDTRESPGSYLHTRCTAICRSVVLHDPSMSTDDPVRAALGADILVIATDWPTYSEALIGRARELHANMAPSMKPKPIIDGRNLLDPVDRPLLGAPDLFEVYGVGRRPWTT